MKDLLVKLGLETIDGYKFVKTLGKGKAALTCLYRKNKKNRVYKFLILPRNEEELESFKYEANINKIITDNNVKCFPKLYTNLTKCDGLPVYYFSIEYIEGETLFDYIEKNPLPWEWEKALIMLGNLSRSLNEISRHNIVHRDIHLGNIMLKKGFSLGKNFFDANEDIVIIDIGCCKDNFYDLCMQNYSEAYREPEHIRHFAALSAWSPEFLTDPANVDLTHDSWALGIIFYQLLTGNYPFTIKNFGELYEKVVTNYQIEFDELEKKNIPNEIISISKNLLNQNPRFRYSTKAITNVCDAIINRNLLSKSEEMIEFILQSGGDAWICLTCHNIVIPDGSRCPKCGRISDEWYPWYDYEML